MVQKLVRPVKNFFRVNFVAGMFVMLPLSITTGILVWTWIALSKPLDLLIAKYKFDEIPWTQYKLLPKLFSNLKALDLVAPLIAFVVLFLLIWALGVVIRSFVGRTLWGFVEGVLARVPLVGVLYTSIKQLAGAFISADGTTKFRSAALVQFPMKGCWVIGFITGDAVSSLAETMKTGWKAEDSLSDSPPEEILTVFVPTTPLPTQGFTLVLPKSEVQELPISVPDAIKLVVSGGILSAKPGSSSQRTAPIIPSASEESKDKAKDTQATPSDS